MESFLKLLSKKRQLLSNISQARQESGYKSNKFCREPLNIDVLEETRTFIGR